MRNSTKISKRGRGRPRSYDPENALRAALGVFWKHGFSATSLDALSEATGMNRPSLYGAFGDKKSIYRKALVQKQREMRGLMQRTLFKGESLEADLLSFFETLREVYRDGDAALGCPTICTATAEASDDPEIQAALSMALGKLDATLRRRFELAARDEDFGGDPGVCGAMTAAILHSLAVRMRAGQSDEKARLFVEKSVRMLLCSVK